MQDNVTQKISKLSTPSQLSGTVVNEGTQKIKQRARKKYPNKAITFRVPENVKIALRPLLEQQQLSNRIVATSLTLSRQEIAEGELSQSQVKNVSISVWPHQSLTEQALALNVPVAVLLRQAASKLANQIQAETISSGEQITMTPTPDL